MPEGRPTIVVQIEGGLLRSVHCSEPAEILYVNHDVGDAADEDEIRDYAAECDRANRTIDRLAIHEVY